MITEQQSLKNYNTFGVVVRAKYFASVNNLAQLRELIKGKKYANTPKLILGGGSNLLFTKDFDGLVLHNAFKGMEMVKEDEQHIYLRVYGGEVWHDLVLHCVENGWAGIENLSLIPGSVGAAPIQNIGAYGVELEEVFHSLDALHLATGEVQTFHHADCEFGYRDSIFKKKLKGKVMVLSVVLRLNKQATFKTEYGAVKRVLEQLTAAGSPLTIRTISDAICQIRSSKLPDPKVLGNSGSFFKNPVVTPAFFDHLKEQYPSIPHYPLANGQVKIPAAWLIQQCDWKGKRFGDAGVHKNHSLVLVNYGNAKGQEIKDLSEKIQDSVQNRFGIALHAEVNIL